MSSLIFKVEKQVPMTGYVLDTYCAYIFYNKTATFNQNKLKIHLAYHILVRIIGTDGRTSISYMLRFIVLLQKQVFANAKA